MASEQIRADIAVLESFQAKYARYIRFQSEASLYGRLVVDQELRSALLRASAGVMAALERAATPGSPCAFDTSRQLRDTLFAHESDSPAFMRFSGPQDVQAAVAEALGNLDDQLAVRSRCRRRFGAFTRLSLIPYWLGVVADVMTVAMVVAGIVVDPF